MRHDEIEPAELMDMNGEPLISGTVRITRGLSPRLWTGQFSRYDEEPRLDLMPGRYLLRHGQSVDLVELKRGYSLWSSAHAAPDRVVFNSVIAPAEVEH